MTGLKFKHLGVAVANLDEALASYQTLFGYRLLSGPYDDPVQRVTVAFVGVPESGDPVVELVVPLGENSPVKKYLTKRVSAYHVCYEATNLDEAIGGLVKDGCVLVSEPVPAVAFNQSRIAWLYTPTQQLLELVEA